MEFHLFDLPLDDFCVELRPTFRNRFFGDCLKKFKNLMRFARAIDENLKNIRRWKNGMRSPTIKVLFKIIQACISSEIEIEKNIYKLKRCGGFIKNPILPIFVDDNLAKIIAATFCDGGISKDNIVHYTNKNLKLFKSFKKAVKRVFGEVHIIYEYKRNDIRVYQINYSGVMGNILHKIFEVPKRSKIFIDAPIPKIIIESDTKVIKSFIRQCFDDEGWCSKDIGFARTIVKENMKSKRGPLFLQDLKYLLENKFGITVHGPRLCKERSYIRNCKKIQVYDYELKVCDRKSLELFHNKIGFSIDYKMRALKNKLRLYKMWQIPNGESLNFFLRKAGSFVLNEGKSFSVFDLASLTKRTVSRTNQVINELQKNGFVKIFDYKKDSMNRYETTMYTLTNKGANSIFNLSKDDEKVQGKDKILNS